MRLDLHTAAARIVVAVSLLAGASCNGCRPAAPSPEEAREASAAFHVGLAAMETGQDDLARARFERVGVLAPREPAGWANLGLLLVRRQANDEAASVLARAAALDPDNPAILKLQALAERRRGRMAEALVLDRRAVEQDPQDLKALFALAVDLEAAGGVQNDDESLRLIERVTGPAGNLAAGLEWARLAARRGDRTGARRVVTLLSTRSSAWPDEARQRLGDLRVALEGPDTSRAALAAVLLKNVLLPEPEYQQALRAISAPADLAGEPLTRPVTLPQMNGGPAAPDLAMSVGDLRPGEAGGGSADARSALAAWRDSDGPPVIATTSRGGVHVGGSTFRVPGARIVVAADLNADYLSDLIVAGVTGLTLLRQAEGGTFVDVTSAARLPAGLRRTVLSGLWSADVDLDGDLDVVIAQESGASHVLRNNTDDTFVLVSVFEGAENTRDFAWADLDGEGTPDAAFLDAAGRLQVFLNLRGGRFERRAGPAGFPPGAAITAADVTGSDGFDLVVLGADHAIRRVVLTAEGAWAVAQLAAPAALPAVAAGVTRIVSGDLDNNGATDFVISGLDGGRIFLGGAGGPLTLLDARVPLGACVLLPSTDAGPLDIVGIDGAGRPAIATMRRTTSYKWQTLRPRAASNMGDQRINSFGIGGEVEVRTGLLSHRQVIASPVVHVGLGDAGLADVVRITWPNGVLQAEFDLPAGASIRADQRLKGSCPWLFGWNGSQMGFLTDVIWRSPLGLRINAQSTADVLMTEDRVKIPGDRLAPRDGVYDLRITAELWETHFFDLVSLLVVDHPAGTEVFVDERFAIPAPSLEAVATGPVQPFAAVRDDTGRDVAGIVGARDDRHLAFAGLGAYQGLTRMHAVEFDVPEAAPRAGPLWLVATGWVHPTDSSVNVAISQGAHAIPSGLALSVEVAPGVFREVRPNLGFPAGKDKTVLIDLADVFPAGSRRRARLSTNLEIYWDRLGWAVGRPDVSPVVRRVELRKADLQFRGYSRTTQADPSVPERPAYELAGTATRWRDLEGFYTRFGDVRPLLGRVDDRYVILNAGDELRLAFEAQTPPAAGLVRDFVFVGDGWVKDGDFNTSFSRTVLPLPTHASGQYAIPPRRLADDPVYQRHARDFVDYHTRYVTPLGTGLRRWAEPRPR